MGLSSLPNSALEDVVLGSLRSTQKTIKHVCHQQECLNLESKKFQHAGATSDTETKWWPGEHAGSFEAQLSVDLEIIRTACLWWAKQAEATLVHLWLAKATKA